MFITYAVSMVEQTIKIDFDHSVVAALNLRTFVIYQLSTCRVTIATCMSSEFAKSLKALEGRAESVSSEPALFTAFASMASVMLHRHLTHPI